MRHPIEYLNKLNPNTLEVWDDLVPPGGMVCGICGTPVESSPCENHNPEEIRRLCAESVRTTLEGMYEYLTNTQEREIRAIQDNIVEAKND